MNTVHYSIEGDPRGDQCAQYAQEIALYRSILNPKVVLRKFTQLYDSSFGNIAACRIKRQNI